LSLLVIVQSKLEADIFSFTLLEAEAMSSTALEPEPNSFGADGLRCVSALLGLTLVGNIPA
jgi:hypothetical protein